MQCVFLSEETTFYSLKRQMNQLQINILHCFEETASVSACETRMDINIQVNKVKTDITI